jgi:DNA repair exonuclease SbcCD nuclease subunit
MIFFSADWHLRKTRPKSRTDDFLISQEKKIRYIFQLVQDNNCPLIIAGDLFELPRPGEFVKQWIINLIGEYGIQILAVPGQHDIPNHNLALINDSGIGVLAAAGVITLLTDPNKPVIVGKYAIYGCPFGTDPSSIVFKKGMSDKIKVLLWHRMTILEPLWKEQIADLAGQLLRLYPQFDIVCTGDNHQSFTYDRKGKHLINPGSVMRKNADQQTHLPSVYSYNNGEVERIYLPIEEDVFNVSHIKAAKEKEARYGDFIGKLHTGFKVGIDLNHNFISFFEQNKIRKSVESLVWECIPDE